MGVGRVVQYKYSREQKSRDAGEGAGRDRMD